MTDAEFIKNLVEEEKLREESNALPDCIIVVIAAILFIVMIFLVFFTPFLLLILKGMTL